MIETGGSGRLWLLSGPDSSYALRLTDRDELLHVHWGSRITLPDAEALAADPLPPRWPFEPAPDGHEEYPAGGGPRSVRPALSVRPRTGDGEPVPGGEWCFEEHEAAEGPDGDELRLHFHDSPHHLDLTLHYRLRPGCDVVERWITAGVTTGGDPGGLDLLRADSAVWTPPPRDEWRLSHLHGGRGAESRLARAALTPGEQVLAGCGGHAAQRHLPWFALDAGDAGEEHGEVWTGALAWSGSWRIAVAALPGGRVRAAGGAGHDGSRLLRLAPGTCWVSPVFAGLYTRHGFGAASRAWHAYQLSYVLPPAAAPRPVRYGPARPAGTGTGHARRRELVRRAAALGVELFVADGGPYGEAGPCGQGPYNEGGTYGDGGGHGEGAYGDGGSSADGGSYGEGAYGDGGSSADGGSYGEGSSYGEGGAGGPGRVRGAGSRAGDGLKALADEVHALGMRFGVRVEPETVSADGDLARAHPDWALPAGGRRGDAAAGRLVLDLARPDVRAHLWDRLDTLLRAVPVDFVSWDAHRPPADAERPGESCPRLLPAGHTEGLYALLDRLRAAHPAVEFESRAAGGRIDLGILARTGQVWTSDNTDPLDRLRIQHGFSQLHPARAMTAQVNGGPGRGINRRSSSLRFRFVSAMAGVVGIGGDLLEWSDDERAEAASWVSLYKTVRPVVQNGDLYRLRPPGDGGLSAVQYVRGADTVVLAWLHAQSFGEPVPPLRLRGLDAAATYRDVVTGVAQRGAVLAERGLRTTLGGDLDAAVFHLRRL